MKTNIAELDARLDALRLPFLQLRIGSAYGIRSRMLYDRIK